MGWQWGWPKVTVAQGVGDPGGSRRGGKGSDVLIYCGPASHMSEWNPNIELRYFG